MLNWGTDLPTFNQASTMQRGLRRQTLYQSLARNGRFACAVRRKLVVEPGYIGGILLDIKKAGLSSVRGRKEK